MYTWPSVFDVMSSIKSLPPSSRYKSKISNQKNPETKSFVPPSNLLWMQQNSVCFATASPKPSESSSRHPPLFSRLPSEKILKSTMFICRPITKKKCHFLNFLTKWKISLLWSRDLLSYQKKKLIRTENLISEVDRTASLTRAFKFNIKSPRQI